VHGTGANGTTTWSPLLRQLSAELTVVLPDLRGSGATHDPGGPLELDVLAEDVLAAATDAGFEEFDLAGFSLGGAVAASLAAACDRVRSLTIIAAPPSGLDSRTRLQFDFWTDLYAQDAALFARYWLLAGLSPDFVAAIPGEELALAASFPIEPGLERQSTLNTRVDLTPILPSIRVRTLVIGCAHDTIVPSQQTKALAAAIPRADYLELETGHMAILEAPSVVARTILEHVNAG
jgi:3-oxoadipate enol-lactonase